MVFAFCQTKDLKTKTEDRRRMNCTIFTDKISAYLDGEMQTREKAEFAAHRLSCRDCRDLFNEVRDTLTAMGEYAQLDVITNFDTLEARIVDATSAGEMLSCTEFDKMIERYFDGVILGPTFQTFQAHFEDCWKCRRLLRGIEEAKEMLREVKEEVEVPRHLSRRIMAATVGNDSNTFFDQLARSLKAGQWVAAFLIFAATGMLINYRYGSVENMAAQASERALERQEQINQAVTNTGTMAIAGMEFISVKLQNREQRKKNESGPQPAPAPSATDHQSPTTDHR